MNRPLALSALILMLVGSSPLPARCGDSGGLERTYQLGVDARALGLGNSTALTGDAGAALSVNPGLLGTVGRAEIFAMHAPLFEGARYEAVGVVLPTLDTGTFAFSYIDVRTPDVEERDEANFLLGTFDYGERKAAAAWGLALPVSGLSAGFSGRWFQQRMARWSGESFGVDVGVAFHPEDARWSLGASSEELYDSGIRLAEDRERAPRGAHLGGSYELPVRGGLLTLAAGTHTLEAGGTHLSGGAEYLWHRLAALRAGWDGDHLNAGAGVDLASWSVQYAVAFEKPAGITHRLSAAYRFGRDVIRARAERVSREERLKAEVIEKMKRESIQNYLSSGDAAFSDQRYEDAKTEYEKVLAWDPQNPDALERVQKAADASRAAAVQAKLADARKLRADGNDLDAMVLYKSVLEIDPQNSEAAQGLTASGKRLRDASRKAFASAPNLSPTEAQECFEKGLEHYLAGRYSQALDQWKLLVASNPLQRQVFEYVSRAQVRLESDQSTAFQKQKAAVKEDRLKWLRKKAFEDYRKGDLKAAVESWSEVLRMDPGNAEAQAELEKSQKELQDSMKRGVRW